MKSISPIRLAFRRIFRLFFPPKCPFCRRILFSDGWICEDCIETLPRTPKFFCAGCHQPGEDLFRRCSCGGTWCVSPFPYTGTVRIALLRYKFHHKKVYAHSFAAILAEELIRLHGADRVEMTTFVPTTKKSRKERGYDPSEVLAKRLAKCLGIPCVPLLTPGNKRYSQRDLSVRQRYINAKNGFGLLPGIEVSEKRLLLCDDILTTGATMMRCAELLQEMGAEVLGCTVAHGKTIGERKWMQRLGIE